MKKLFSTVSVLAFSIALTAQTRPPAPMAPAEPTGRRIIDDGLVANYFPASGRAPGVLMLGGSVGGLSLSMNQAAIALQAEGFSTLHLSFFRAPGQSARLELVPLEYFGRALDWLRRQPEVDPDRLAIIGGSRGAEAALLVATRHDELKAVIAAVPSSVVWPGLNENGIGAGVASAWSEAGTPVPSMPNDPYDPAAGGTMVDNQARRLRTSDQHPDAIIPVERIRAPLFLVCAEADQVWPSCPMARRIEQRLRERGRPAPILLAYEGADHQAFGPALPTGVRPGGANAGDEKTVAARADSWPKAVTFLKTHLAKK